MFSEHLRKTSCIRLHRLSQCSGFKTLEIMVDKLLVNFAKCFSNKHLYKTYSRPTFLVYWIVFHIEIGTKWSQFCKRHFQKHFLEWKSLYFLQISLESEGPFNNESSLAHSMDWHRIEPMTIRFADAHTCRPTSICWIPKWMISCLQF